MNSARPRFFQLAAATWVTLGMAAMLLNALPPMGIEAANSVQSWWTVRRFQQADADLDLLGMRDLGVEYLRRSGDGTPLDFAIYRVGFAASGPSMNRLPADALDWALIGAQMADDFLNELPSPWASLQTQAHILVERGFPISNDPDHLRRGLRAMEMWLASGGGRQQLSKLTSQAYRTFITTPAENRSAFLIQRMSGDSSAESRD